METNQQLNLRDVLFAAMKEKLSAHDYAALILYGNWISICGEAIGEKTKPSGLKRNILTVSVENPALSFELGFIKADLINKINCFLSGLENGSENRRFPSPSENIKIKEIRFVSK